MVRARVSAALAVACLSSPAVALADPLSGSLQVERAAGAETCADADALRRDVEALAGSPILTSAEQPDVTITVRIKPKGSGFQAVVVAGGARQGERLLEDSGPGCDVLGHGLVVIVALLLDAPVEPPGNKQGPPVPPSHAPPVMGMYVLPEVPPLPEEKAAPLFPPLMGSIGPAYVTGIVPSDAAGMTVSFEGYLPLVSFGASIVWIPHEPTEPGAVYSYVGARTRACARQPDLEQYGIAACLRFGAGLRSATLEDPASEVVLDEASGAYAALGGQLEISRRIVGPLGVYADFGVDVAVAGDALDLAAGKLVVTSDEPGISFDAGFGLRFWLQPEPEPEGPDMSEL